MSNPSDEQDTTPETGSSHGGEGISDDLLPDDVRPGEDNPLAVPLEEGEEIEGTAPPTPDAPA